ncbi:MAG TPA: acyl-CoA dehydrogenase family protein [Bosea sp. (in: a-proteobacteria)]|jgi:putative acyl-CoA dehydrogenase|uniref:acyl-CoA dehydrogenase family protein n=1 Tax=Bosea sp. (in: a-proteobacteria) TaxID=1871050 RepID=UPI002E13A604|nr:acyl-CoA dehydrogenase family protein [Bosea sp. (in: a-proteobacteria)]
MARTADRGFVHEVTNQVPVLADYDAFAADPVLRAAISAFGADWAGERLHEAGRCVGSAHVQELARQANRFTPELRTHDRFGNRIDQIAFHPAWHELMGLAICQEAHALAWNQPRPGAQVARAALTYMWTQGESGICCPISMTYSAIPLLRQDAARWAEWGALVSSSRYDARQGPAAAKTGATVGTAMTEVQGGSDLRQTQTVATDNRDGTFSLTGQKWFFSVPHSDLFLTLARTGAGISCFVVPGWLPDGARNGIAIQRLKDKCGNRSNASSEVEFRGAIGHMLGEPGRGLRTGLSMNHNSRLDIAASAAGLMRQAVSLAAHHAAHRHAFQRVLIDQPIMQNVLADLAIEAEAAAWLAFRLFAAVDRQEASESERLLARIGAPIAKYWLAKRAPAVVVEALECHGGNGFIEENPMARLYREAPLNSIWEGSGNVICLDVLRSLEREPGTLPALLGELGEAKGVDRRFDAALTALRDEMPELTRHEGQARRLVERLAVMLQAALLLRYAPERVADAFVASRIEGAWSGHFGDLPAWIDSGALARRAVPELA